VALATVAVCLGAGWAAAFLPAKQYKATATLLAQPAPGNTDPSGAVAVLEYLVPQLPTEATNSATVNSARSLLPSQEASAQVKIDSSSNPSTGVLTIDVTSTDPHLSAAFANALAQQVKTLQPKHALYELVQLSPAQPPSSPANPRTPILTAAGGFGVILAVFTSLGAASIRRRRSRAIEIKDRIGINVLGEIPKLRAGGIRPSELFIADHQPVAMEAFQELRSNLLLIVPTDRPASIAVTSCAPAEGKTSVAGNLSWALAAADRQVTAVDCDLRHPNLHLVLDVPYGPGVSSATPDYAIEHASLSKNHNLAVIPAGISDRHPSDIMSSNLPQLLDELRAHQNTVIVDCPPLIGAAETILIASIVDVVIVVVDTRRFNAERLQQCILRLEASGTTEVGVVLNRVRFGRKRRKEVYQYALNADSTTSELPGPRESTNPGAHRPAPSTGSRRNAAGTPRKGSEAAASTRRAAASSAASLQQNGAASSATEGQQDEADHDREPAPG